MLDVGHAAGVVDVGEGQGPATGVVVAAKVEAAIDVRPSLSPGVSTSRISTGAVEMAPVWTDKSGLAPTWRVECVRREKPSSIFVVVEKNR